MLSHPIGTVLVVVLLISPVSAFANSNQPAMPTRDSKIAPRSMKTHLLHHSTFKTNVRNSAHPGRKTVPTETSTSMETHKVLPALLLPPEKDSHLPLAKNERNEQLIRRVNEAFKNAKVESKSARSNKEEP